MSRHRRKLATLHKLHHKGKRAISQRESHLANLRRELREDETAPVIPWSPTE